MGNRDDPQEGEPATAGFPVLSLSLLSRNVKFDLSLGPALVCGRLELLELVLERGGFLELLVPALVCVSVDIREKVDAVGEAIVRGGGPE